MNISENHAPSPHAISLFTSAADTHPRAVVRGWAEIADRISRPVIRSNKDGPLFSPATFDPPVRASRNVVSLSLLVLDYDHHAKLESDLEPWRRTGLAFAMYTTFSHRRECKSNPEAEDRFRVIVPLLTAIPGDKFPLLWLWAAACSGERIDPSAKDTSRMYYTPAKAAIDAPYEYEVVEGDVLDWRTLNLTAKARPHVRPPEHEPRASNRSPHLSISAITGIRSRGTTKPLEAGPMRGALLILVMERLRSSFALKVALLAAFAGAQLRTSGPHSVIPG